MRYDVYRGARLIASGQIDERQQRKTARQPAEDVSELLTSLWIEGRTASGDGFAVGDVVLLDGWAPYRIDERGYSAENAKVWFDRMALLAELDRNPDAEVVVNGEVVGRGLAGMAAAAQKMAPEVAVDDETALELLDEAVRRQTGRHPQEG